MSVFVVFGESGEYSDWSKWPICHLEAGASEEDAQSYVVLLTVAWKEYCKNRRPSWEHGHPLTGEAEKLHGQISGAPRAKQEELRPAWERAYREHLERHHERLTSWVRERAPAELLALWPSLTEGEVLPDRDVGFSYEAVPEGRLPGAAS